MMPQLGSRRIRRGYSLAEMLIVVTIMIMLMAVTLPMAKKMMDGSQVREASRSLHGYFAMARSRALQTGRPCGLYFPFPQPPLGLTDPTGMTPVQITQYWPVRQVTQMYLAEVPPYYSGGTTSARGKIWDPTGNAAGARMFQPVAADGSADQSGELQFLQSLIDPGDVFFVRFNYKGEWYRCKRGIATDNTFNNPNALYYIGASENTTVPFGYNDTTSNNSGGRSFQVMRMPRPVGNPLELPRGACIDITYSGVGTSNRGFPPPATGLTQIAAGLAVMISPSGEIDALYMNGAPTIPPSSSLFFLIGKPEKVPSDTATATIYNPVEFTDPEKSNLADPTSLWVSVSRTGGQVTTSENIPPLIEKSSLSINNLVLFPGEQPPPNGRYRQLDANSALGQYLFYCRQSAIYGEQIGGQ